MCVGIVAELASRSGVERSVALASQSLLEVGIEGVATLMTPNTKQQHVMTTMVLHEVRKKPVKPNRIPYKSSNEPLSKRIERRDHTCGIREERYTFE